MGGTGAGDFSATSTLGGDVGQRLWAKPCGRAKVGATAGATQAEANMDCGKCGVFTNAKFGVCVDGDGSAATGISGYCGANLPTATINVNSPQCQMPALILKFSNTGTQGSQNLLECNIGASTNVDGHSPKYDSSALEACSVI